MRPRAICLTVLLFIFSLDSTLQDAQAHSGHRGEVDSLIDRVESRYRHMRGLAADFEQIYREPGSVERRERGRLILQRPGRMRWEYNPKPGKLFIVSGNEVWFYVAADGEAVHGRLQPQSDARFPFLFLLGRANLRHQFRIIELMDEDHSTSNYRTLRMVPRRNIAEVHEMLLKVALDGKIVGLRMIDELGSSSEISLTNIHENFVAPSNAFIFHPPSGVSVRRQK